MHIAVLCGSYDPKPSAVAICAMNVVHELKELGHEVSVILPYDGYNSSEDIIRFKESDYTIYYSGNRLLKLYIRTKRYLSAFFKRYNLNSSAIKGYIKSLKSLHSRKPIDIIVPFSFPFESIISSVKFCEDSNIALKIEPVIFDNFIENTSLHRSSINRTIKRKVHTKLVFRYLDKCYQIFVVHSQKEYFKFIFPSLLPKVTFIEHPLLILPKYNISSNGHLLYSGSFLRGYVKSENLVRLLERILPQLECKIDFCVMGNDVSNIEELAKKFPKQIFNHGKVPFCDAENYIASSSILVSVAEISGIQISSKIFTYMATGKPIIQFYYSDNDINVKILERYPLSHKFRLNDKNEYSTETVDSLVAFINSNLNKTVPYAEVYSLYPDASPYNLALNIENEHNRSANE